MGVTLFNGYASLASLPPSPCGAGRVWCIVARLLALGSTLAERHAADARTAGDLFRPNPPICSSMVVVAPSIPVPMVDGVSLSAGHAAVDTRVPEQQPRLVESRLVFEHFTSCLERLLAQDRQMSMLNGIEYRCRCSTRISSDLRCRSHSAEIALRVKESARTHQRTFPPEEQAPSGVLLPLRNT